METKLLIEELLSRIGAGDADGASAMFANAIDFAIPHQGKFTRYHFFEDAAAAHAAAVAG